MKKSIFIAGILLGLILVSGFKQNQKDLKNKGFVQIPAGVAMHEGKNTPMNSYWISKYEVTNNEYNDFLNYLQKEGMTERFEICKVHNEKWSTMLEKKNEPYVQYYSTHEAYGSYPVLNISHEAAALYCEWLTENQEDKNHIFRLPTKDEWIYAATGGLVQANYSWGGLLRNKKGELMCNFKYIGDEFIHSDSENNLSIISEYKKNDNFSSIPAPVDSYLPNKYGLYNTCGNVAEMINEKGIAMGGSWNCPGYDVRITSELKYNEPNPFVGFRPVRVTKE